MKKIKTSLIAFSAMLMVSCSDFLEDYSQELSRVEKWQDLDELLLGEGYMKSSRFTTDQYNDPSDLNPNLDILHYMSDELTQYADFDKGDPLAIVQPMFPFYTWQRDTGMDEDGRYMGGDEKYWNFLYERINIVNMVLSEIDNMPEADADDKAGKERVKGEALFLRAAYYFLLTNLYGEPYVPSKAESALGVPMKLTEYVEDIEFERASLKTLYSQITDDLTLAESLLDGKSRKSIYHANDIAAYLLHSRVALYMQDWQTAADMAAEVIERQPQLRYLADVAPGSDAITKDSPETIFSMGGYLVAINFADYEGMFGDYYPTYTVSDDIVQLFDDDDYRKSLYLGESDLFGIENVFLKVNGQRRNWSKYYDVSDCFLLRTPEAYLTMAEANAYLGKEDDARATLRKFLATRMMGAVNVTESGKELVDLIRNERAKEFLLEGHRWFDLRRYTVCEPYPWSKTIEHAHVYYDRSRYDILETRYYRLEANDKAYTLPIPRKITNFQISLGKNERPDREPFNIIHN